MLQKKGKALIDKQLEKQKQEISKRDYALTEIQAAYAELPSEAEAHKRP